ncbi:MAG: hypothetical protein V7725_01195 [Porticoccus sp.]
MNSEDLLHVAPPIETQHATNRGISNNNQSNDEATISLKAAAARVLSRNNQGNNGATSHEKRCNIGPKKGGDLLQMGRLRINQAIQGLPVSLDEVMTSELFVEVDIKDVGSGKYSLVSLRLYVGSWLVNGKVHPAPEYRDYVKLLGGG